MRWWVTVVSSLASVQHKRQEETNLFFYIFCDHDLLSFIVNDWKSVEKMEVKLERLKVSHLLFLCLHCSSSVLSFLFEKETALPHLYQNLWLHLWPIPEHQNTALG